MNCTFQNLPPIQAVNHFDKKQHQDNNLFIFFTTHKIIKYYSLIIIIKQITNFRKNLFPLLSLVLQFLENFLFDGLF